MSTIKISGKIVYEQLEGGFWGIEADNGQQYRPVNLPKELQENGKKVKVTATEVDEMGIFMWGIPVKIKSIDT